MSMKITHVRMTGSTPETITHLKTEYGSIFTRAEMYDKVRAGGDYAVNTYPYPRLVAVNGPYTQYVKSAPDSLGRDNLVNLPRF